jgi:hypothetical protein
VSTTSVRLDTGGRLMKKLIGGGLAALAVGVALGVAPVASADHCDPPGSPCHEFDQFDPYLDSFERNGIGYLTQEFSVPLMNQASWVCAGEPSREEIQTVGVSWLGTPKQQGRMLTDAEVDAVIEAAYDVCPEMRP